MAYIIKRKNREGKEYVYLVEGYRDKDKVRQRTLKSYGQLEVLERNEPGAFERLRRQAKEGLLSEKIEKEINIPFQLDSPISNSLKNYGWMFLDDLLRLLKVEETLRVGCQGRRFKFDPTKILKLLVYQRILDSGSKTKARMNQDELFGDWKISSNDMDRALYVFAMCKDELLLTMHQQITQTIGRTATLVYYDVTNYYYETDLDDPDVLDEDGEIQEVGMRKRGPSKERRPNPIVQMGLFMDQNSIPISYELFPGNYTDPITYLPSAERVKKQFEIERLVSVADKAMNSKKNVLAIYERGDGWLFSQKHRGKRGAPKDIQEFILKPEGWEYNNRQTFAKKSTIRERNLGNGVVVKEKVLVTWSEAYAKREKIRRDGALAYAASLRDPERYRMTCKKGGKKYLEQYVVDKQTGERQVLHPFIGIDYELVDFDAQFDGINVLVTSELKMSDEEMMANYRQLYKIEECFRITKTELKTRPVYVTEKNHIEAHFLTCFIALVLLRIVQYLLDGEWSVSIIVDSLKSALTDELGQGYMKVYGNEDWLKILEKLKIDWKQQIVKLEKLKQFGRGWCTTKDWR